MKNFEAVIPNPDLRSTIDQLRLIEVQDVVIETVKVAKKGQHQTMTYRGCTYQNDIVSAAKIGFSVPDQNVAQAEAILSHVTLH